MINPYFKQINELYTIKNRKIANKINNFIILYLIAVKNIIFIFIYLLVENLPLVSLINFNPSAIPLLSTNAYNIPPSNLKIT